LRHWFFYGSGLDYRALDSAYSSGFGCRAWVHTYRTTRTAWLRVLGLPTTPPNAITCGSTIWITFLVPPGSARAAHFRRVLRRCHAHFTAAATANGFWFCARAVRTAFAPAGSTRRSRTPAAHTAAVSRTRRAFVLLRCISARYLPATPVAHCRAATCGLGYPLPACLQITLVLAAVFAFFCLPFFSVRLRSGTYHTRFLPPPAGFRTRAWFLLHLPQLRTHGSPRILPCLPRCCCRILVACCLVFSPPTAIPATTVVRGPAQRTQVWILVSVYTAGYACLLFTCSSACHCLAITLAIPAHSFHFVLPDSGTFATMPVGLPHSATTCHSVIAWFTTCCLPLGFLYLRFWYARSLVLPVDYAAPATACRIRQFTMPLPLVRRFPSYLRFCHLVTWFVTAHLIWFIPPLVPGATDCYTCRCLRMHWMPPAAVCRVLPGFCGCRGWDYSSIRPPACLAFTFCCWAWTCRTLPFAFGYACHALIHAGLVAVVPAVLDCRTRIACWIPACRLPAPSSTLVLPYHPADCTLPGWGWFAWIPFAHLPRPAPACKLRLPPDTHLTTCSCACYLLPCPSCNLPIRFCAPTFPGHLYPPLPPLPPCLRVTTPHIAGFTPHLGFVAWTHTLPDYWFPYRLLLLGSCLVPTLPLVLCGLPADALRSRLLTTPLRAVPLRAACRVAVTRLVLRHRLPGLLRCGYTHTPAQFCTPRDYLPRTRTFCCWLHLRLPCLPMPVLRFAVASPVLTPYLAFTFGSQHTCPYLGTLLPVCGTRGLDVWCAGCAPALPVRFSRLPYIPAVLVSATSACLTACLLAPCPCLGLPCPPDTRTCAHIHLPAARLRCRFAVVPPFWFWFWVVALRRAAHWMRTCPYHRGLPFGWLPRRLPLPFTHPRSAAFWIAARAPLPKFAAAHRCCPVLCHRDSV